MHDPARAPWGAPPRRRAGLLRRLNLHGLDHLDAVLLAALASEAPLLLIGPHGSAKSALLERVAGALEIEHRHYNASLLSFDDLVGFPVPNAARDGLDYLRTPATLWGAQSVFLDEISRCRPETQNKLFSIVHERRVMGIALDRLRWRWAAMNPPAGFDAGGEIDDAYLGSQPLDPALADRFCFVVPLPTFIELEPKARRAAIAEGHLAVDGDAGLPALLEAARVHAALSEEADDGWVVGYVDALVGLLVQAKLPISGRRAGMLRQAIHAVRGARAALDQGGPGVRGSASVESLAGNAGDGAGEESERCGGGTAGAANEGNQGLDTNALADAALVALRNCLPQRAQGREIAESKLLAIHRKAVEVAAAEVGTPLRTIHAEPDPLKRVAIALSMPDGTLSRTAFSALVGDAFAAQDVPGRYLLARRLIGALAERDLVNAPTLELLAEPIGRLLDFERAPEHRIEMTRSEVQRFNALLAVISRMDRHDPAQAALGNVLYTLATVERASFDPERALERDAELALLLGQPPVAVDLAAGAREQA